MSQQKVSAVEIINDLPFSPRQWLIVGLCMLAVIFDGYEMQMISYVVPIISKEWGLSPVLGGLLASAGFLGMLFGALALGTVADYIGRKKALVLGLCIFSIFTFLAGITQSFNQLVALRFLAGLGMGGVLPIGITIAAEFCPIHLRTRTIAIVTGGFTIGFAIAATASIFVIPSFGWRPMFYLGGLPLLLVPFLLKYLPESIRYLLGKNKRNEAAHILRLLEKSSGKVYPDWNEQSLVMETDAKGEKKSTLRELWSSEYRWITFRSSFMYLFLQIVVVAFNFWLATLLIKRGFSLVRSYSYGLEQGIAAAVGGLLLGWMIDKYARKYGRKYLMAGIFIIGAFSLWLFGLASSVAALYFFNGLATAFIIGGQNIVHTMITEVYPTHMRSTAVGWGLGVGRIGSIIAPTLGGVLLSLNLSFYQYFVIFSLPMIIVALIVISFPREGVPLKHNVNPAMEGSGVS